MPWAASAVAVRLASVRASARAGYLPLAAPGLLARQGPQRRQHRGRVAVRVGLLEAEPTVTEVVLDVAEGGQNHEHHQYLGDPGEHPAQGSRALRVALLTPSRPTAHFSTPRFAHRGHCA